MGLAVEIHPIFDMTEARRAKALADAEDNHQFTLLRTIVREASYNLWFDEALIPHLFNLCPLEWKNVDIAAFLAVDEGTVSRYRKHLGRPSLEIIRFWLDAFDSTLPGMGDQIYFAYGLGSAINRVKLEATSKPLSEPRRRIAIAVEESTLADAAILYALVRPPVFEHWLEVAMANRADLEVVFNDTSFTKCLANLIDRSSGLFGNPVANTRLSNAQKSLADINLESTKELREFVVRSVELWNTTAQFTLEQMKNDIGSYFNM